MIVLGASGMTVTQVTCIRTTLAHDGAVQLVDETVLEGPTLAAVHRVVSLTVSLWS